MECLEWSERGFIYRGRKGYEFIKFGIRNQWKIGKQGVGIKEKRKGNSAKIVGQI